MYQKLSRTLGPTSDLVVHAPWKLGIIEADEAILPSSRFALTFRALAQIRSLAREATELPAFADPIERLEQVHSFRVVAERDALLLSVTYDFGWDHYMHALWDKGGPFLDLLCCNCEHYQIAHETPLPDWSAWISERSILSDYFYSATPLTVGDLGALRQAEQLQRDEPDNVLADLTLAGFTSQTADMLASANRTLAPYAAAVQSFGILAAMHRLTRYYGADISPGAPLRDDALVLLRATKALLHDWTFTDASEDARASFARELAWFEQGETEDAAAVVPAPPVAFGNIQKGILTSFNSAAARVSHGAVLFFMVDNASRACESLALIELATEAGTVTAGQIYRNLAFTFQGMTQLGIGDAILERMPAAFREGAAARAAQVGDMRGFHPRRWQGLPKNWPKASTGEADLSLVDVVVQLRIITPDAETRAVQDIAHPLHANILGLAELPGLTLLSVEALGPADPTAPGRNHLGIQDGISQPLVSAPATYVSWSDQVPASELVLGYAGYSTEPVELKDGSFLAMRRMPLDLDRFDRMIGGAVKTPDLTPEVIKAKLVGRKPDGKPLLACPDENDFRYDSDPTGAACPQQSHIRRVNPRTEQPRIARRGMSFGPPIGAEPSDGEERGSLFMAYCADLARQYEVILGWINGGNSNRVGSYLADPLCGVSEANRTRTYRFSHNGEARRVKLPKAADAYVGLSWSLYLFAPSLEFIRTTVPKSEPPVLALMPPVPAELLARARAIVTGLKAARAGEAQWRNFLDEPGAKLSGLQRAIWQVIRDDEGGCLVTPELALVGSHERVVAILRDDGQTFSVAGAGKRILPSIEKFHLGLDAYTLEYQQEGPAANHAIRQVSEAMAFVASYDTFRAILRGLLDKKATSIDLVRHLLEPGFGVMAPAWYDLPDGKFIEAGASDWRDIADRKPLFPGDFWNSSRYAFNPFQSAETGRLSAAHGSAILKAARALLSTNKRASLKGIVSKALAEATAPNGTLAYPTDDDLARGIIGTMLGSVATTLGNAARLVDSWVNSGLLNRKQLAWVSLPAEKSYQDARGIFGHDMELTVGFSPVPECKWRVPGEAGARLQGIKLGKTSKIVLGLESAAADQAARGIADAHIYFGQAMDGPPTPHGCPGRGMALGILLGLLAALSETAAVKPGSGRFMLEISPRT